MTSTSRPDLTEIEKLVRNHLFKQFRDRVAQDELRKMGPSGVNWIDRTEATLDKLIPRLVPLALHLKKEIPQLLNSAAQVLLLAQQAEGHFLSTAGGVGKLTPEINAWLLALRTAAETSKSLIGNIDSQHVSAEVQRQVIISLNDVLRPNGGSLYPDLLLKDKQYDMLPPQSRIKQIEGPCFRGTNPSNVPDGCEIKTNQGKRIRVDAHGAHAGLHLGITWEFGERGISINGVWAAYVRIADHRESGRNVAVTTVKHSFGHDLFVSLLPYGT
ncbi:MAG: hypothetical protein WCS42_00915 [Verrucomicrobiota bacterium]